MTPSVAVEYSRLIRPFPLRRLSEALYHVEQEAGGIHNTLQRALIDPPRLVSEWLFLLDSLETSLESLKARCDDAAPLLARMTETADADFRRALDALVLVMRGMQATGVEQGEPEDVAA